MTSLQSASRSFHRTWYGLSLEFRFYVQCRVEQKSHCERFCVAQPFFETVLGRLVTKMWPGETTFHPLSYWSTKAWRHPRVWTIYRNLFVSPSCGLVSWCFEPSQTLGISYVRANSHARSTWSIRQRRVHRKGMILNRRIKVTVEGVVCLVYARWLAHCGLRLQSLRHVTWTLTCFPTARHLRVILGEEFASTERILWRGKG